jgi:hypothetical protein
LLLVVCSPPAAAGVLAAVAAADSRLYSRNPKRHVFSPPGQLLCVAAKWKILMIESTIKKEIIK